MQKRLVNLYIIWRVEMPSTNKRKESEPALKRFREKYIEVDDRSNPYYMYLYTDWLANLLQHEQSSETTTTTANTTIQELI